VLAAVVRDYPLVEAARADAEAAQAEALAARGAFDPELRARGQTFPTGPYTYSRLETTLSQPTPLWGASVFGGYRWGGEPGQVPPYYGQYTTLSAGEVRGGVSVPLWRNGPVDARRAGVERADLGEQAAGLFIEQSQLEATRLAALRYWDWVAAGRRLAVAQALLALAEGRDGQLAERVRRGDVPEFERVDNQRALVQRRAQVVSAQRTLQQAAIELALFLRDADGRPLLPAASRLPAGLPEPVPTGAVLGPLDLDAVLARRPDVQRLALQREQGRVQQRLAENQAAPQVDVTVAAARDLGAGDEKLRKTELELGLVLDLPTLNRGGRGRARAAGAGVARLEAQLTLQRDRVAAEVRDALSALDAARERVALARQEVRVARELETGERTRFSLGDSTLLFVNLREQATAEAEVREVDALADFHKAAATLRAAAAAPVALAEAAAEEPSQGER
jgi:outer membrane protein TolC